LNRPRPCRWPSWGFACALGTNLNGGDLITVGHNDVFITGGSQGIGLACAQVMGAAGARIIICGRNPDEGEKVVRDLNGKGLDCHFVGLDVDSEPQVIKVVDAIVAEFSTIDILVNNPALHDTAIRSTLTRPQCGNMLSKRICWVPSFVVGRSYGL
jgi:NADP-dependent 3-hydroxy acid dehydrogenase YdfG